MEKGNCNVVTGALCPPRTEPSKIPRCARRSSSTVRRSCTWFSLVGPIAEETLRHLNADLLFLGVDGFDVHYGLSTPNLLESKVNRVMIEIARRRIAVCDSSKFGRRSLSLIAPTSALHEVITDHGAPKVRRSHAQEIGD
jgi:DeoR family transcriptional regulator of aga operon